MSFANLDLTNVNAAGLPQLKAGTFTVAVTKAEEKKTRSGGEMIELRLEALDGSGYQNATFNTKNSNPEAVRIGLEKFKGFLIAANHPNPDRPQSLQSIIGLKLRLVVEQNGFWKDEHGMDRPSFQPAKSGAFLPLNTGGQTGNAPTPSAVQAQHEFVAAAQPQAYHQQAQSVQPQQTYNQQPQGQAPSYTPDGYPI